MPRTLLSSRLTFVHKFVLPIIWIWGAIWLVRMFFDPNFGLSAELRVFICLIVALNLVWMAWITFRVVKVEADGENFYVSNYQKEIVIPRADLYEATEMRWCPSRTK